MKKLRLTNNFVLIIFNSIISFAFLFYFAPLANAKEGHFKVKSVKPINVDHSLFKKMKASGKFKKGEKTIKNNKFKIHYEEAKIATYEGIMADGIYLPLSKKGKKENYLVYGSSTDPRKPGDGVFIMELKPKNNKVTFYDENGKKMFIFKIEKDKTQLIKGNKSSFNTPFFGTKEAYAWGLSKLWSTASCLPDCIEKSFKEANWFYQMICSGSCYSCIFGGGTGCPPCAVCLGGEALFCTVKCW
jgi:hypothetical protein